MSEYITRTEQVYRFGPIGVTLEGIRRYAEQTGMTQHEVIQHLESQAKTYDKERSAADG